MGMFTSWIDDFTPEELKTMKDQSRKEMELEFKKNSNDPNYKPDCYTKKEK